jgi:hypothetical protein
MSLDNHIRTRIFLTRNIPDKLTICGDRRLLTGLPRWARLVGSLAITCLNGRRHPVQRTSTLGWHRRRTSGCSGQLIGADMLASASAGFGPSSNSSWFELLSSACATYGRDACKRLSHKAACYIYWLTCSLDLARHRSCSTSCCGGWASSRRHSRSTPGAGRTTTERNSYGPNSVSFADTKRRPLHPVSEATGARPLRWAGVR